MISRISHWDEEEVIEDYGTDPETLLRWPEAHNENPSDPILSIVDLTTNKTLFYDAGVDEWWNSAAEEDW